MIISTVFGFSKTMPQNSTTKKSMAWELERPGPQKRKGNTTVAWQWASHQGVFSSKFREQEVSKTNIKGFCKWRHLSAVTYLLLESANSRWLSLVILPPECLSLQEGPANCDIRSGKHGAFRSQTSVETLRKAKWMSDIFLKSPKGKCSVPSKFPLLSTES